MSEENVSLVRQWVSTWADRELISLAAEHPEQLAMIFELIHPEFEGRWASELPDVETYRGLEGAQRMLTEWLEPWREYRQRPMEFVDAGAVTMVPYICHGLGKDSAAEVEMEVTHLYEVRDGKIARLQEYMTKAEALEAAGLPE